MKRTSKKRDAILACLQGTKVHPTAEWVYQTLKPVYPNLSLGTVYRNLSEFKREGLVASVGVVEGLERFDGDTHPHSHLICQKCGAVVDAGSPALSEELLQAAQQRTGGEIDGILLTYTGRCRQCLAHERANS